MDRKQDLQNQMQYCEDELIHLAVIVKKKKVENERVTIQVRYL